MLVQGHTNGGFGIESRSRIGVGPMDGPEFRDRSRSYGWTGVQRSELVLHEVITCPRHLQIQSHEHISTTSPTQLSTITTSIYIYSYPHRNLYAPHKSSQIEPS